MRRWAVGAAGTLALAAACFDGTNPDGQAAALTLSRDSAFVDAGDSIGLRAVATGASGEPLPLVVVDWTSRNAAVATVSAAGVVLVRAAGTAVIVAQSGRAADSAVVVGLAPVTSVALTVHADTIRSLDGLVEIAVEARAGASPRDAPLTVTSADTTVASAWFDATRSRVVARARSAGATTVIAVAASGARDSARITVRPLVATLTIDTVQGELVPGRVIPVQVRAKDVQGRTVPATGLRWTSSDTAVGLVDTAGVVTLVATGTFHVTATHDDGAAAYTRLTVSGPAAFTWRDGDTTIVGVGQEEFGALVVPAAALPGPVTFTIGDPTVVRLIFPTGALPFSGTQGTYPTGLRPGRTTIVPHANGLPADTAVVIVTTAHTAIRFVSLSAPTLEAGHSYDFSILPVDSTGRWHWLASALTFTQSSSDTSVVNVLPASRQATIAAQYAVYPTLQVQAVAAGSAWLRSTAPGFATDSVRVTVVGRPRLTISARRPYLLGAGQRSGSVYYGSYEVTVGASAPLPRAAMTIQLTHTNPTAVALASSTVSLGPTENSAGVVFDAVTPGTDTLIASAPGFDPDTLVTIVTTPTLIVPASLTTRFMPERASLPVRIADSTGMAHVLQDTKLRIASSDTMVIGRQSQWWLSEYSAGDLNLWLSARDTGRTTVTLTDSAGRLPTVQVAVHILPETLRVRTPPLIGLRQTGYGPEFTLTRPDGGQFLWTTAMLTSTDTNVLLVSPVQLGYSQTVAWLTLRGGGTPGTARIITTLSGYVADTSAPITAVAPSVRLDGLPEEAVAGSRYPVRVTILDPQGTPTFSYTSLTFALAAPDGGLAADSPAVWLGRQTSVLIGGSGVQRLIASGSGLSAGYRPDTVTVRVRLPELRLVTAAPSVTLSAGQVFNAVLTRPAEVTWPAPSVSVTERGGHVGVASMLRLSDGGSALVTLTGGAPGVDTLIFAAAGYRPDTVRVVVTEGRLFIATPPTMNVGDSVSARVELFDEAGGSYTSAAAVRVLLTATDALALSVSEVQIDPGASASAMFTIRAVKAGAATLRATTLLARPAESTIQVGP